MLDKPKILLCHVQSMMEVVNMLPPPYMLPSKAPNPVAPLTCVITGKPARYRDPASGHGYADLAAYKQLRERWNSERRGKTGKRTKRQRSSSNLQTTQPLASLSYQAVSAGDAGLGIGAPEQISQAATTNAVAMEASQQQPTANAVQPMSEAAAAGGNASAAVSEQALSAAQSITQPVTAPQLVATAAVVSGAQADAAGEAAQAVQPETVPVASHVLQTQTQIAVQRVSSLPQPLANNDVVSPLASLPH